MSSTITGLGSGFDITSWISQLVSAKKSSLVSPIQTKISTVEKKSSAVEKLESKFKSLESSLKTFTNTIYNSSSDMWQSTSVSSSNSAYVTATSTGNVSAASIDIEVEQVASSTVAKSVRTIGAISKETIEETKFSNFANSQAKTGSFSMFLNGKEYKIEIKEEDSLSDVMDKIDTASGGLIKASVSDDGKFSIKAYKKELDGEGEEIYTEDTDAKLTLGSSADTSNLVSALKMHTEIGTHGYTSNYPLSVVNTSVEMAKAESGIGELRFFDEEGEEAESGTVSINGVEFTIDKETTLNDFVSKVNGNPDAHVKATYDSLTNKLILTSTETGASNISLSEKGTNLLNLLGLTTGSGEEEIIAEGSQTLGNNAKIRINGNDVVSTSNTITGEASGIANLSITVKKQTSNYSGNEDDAEKVTLNIEPDYSKVKTALASFVNSYNDVVSTAKNLTGSEGALSHDTSLNSLISRLKNTLSQTSDNNGVFSLLSNIGISTTQEDTLKLSIDEKKLDEALAKDFDSVKHLFSDGYVDKTDNGVLDRMLTTVSSVLDPLNGYFVQTSTSLKNQLSTLNSNLEKANTKLSAYEARITKQFNNMDSTISSLSTQLSTFQAYMG